MQPAGYATKIINLFIKSNNSVTEWVDEWTSMAIYDCESYQQGNVVNENIS